MKREQRFQAEIKSSIKELVPDAWYFKIPDNARFIGELQRFNPPRPFDAFILYKGSFIALEYKVTGGIALPFAAVSNNQRLSLLNVIKAGGRSYILINYRGLKNFHTQNRVFAIDANYFIFLDQELARKSLPISFCEEGLEVIELERIRLERGYGWNIQKIL